MDDGNESERPNEVMHLIYPLIIIIIIILTFFMHHQHKQWLPHGVGSYQLAHNSQHYIKVKK